MSTVAAVLAAAGTGLTAGVYLAFSTMFMPALADNSAAPALRVMQRINVLALRPIFRLRRPWRSSGRVVKAG